MSTQAPAFPAIVRRPQPIEPNIIREPPKDNPEAMPRRTGETAAFDADGIEGLMRLFIQSQIRAEERNATTLETIANVRPGRLQAWAPTLLTAGLLIFSGVWWTRGTERDVAADVKSLKETVQTQGLELATMRTWNERVRLNLAAEGISIDPETGRLTLGKRKEK